MKKTLVTVLLLSASAAFASSGGFGPTMFPFDPLVAPDGTVLTLRSDQAQNGMGTPMQGGGMELVAIDPSGAIIWSYEAGGGVHDAIFVDNLVVLAVVDGGQYGWWDGAGDEVSTKLVALTLAAGTTAWELELEAVVRNLEASTDRIYAVTGMHGSAASSNSSNTTRRGTRHPGHGSGQPGNPGTNPGNGCCGEQILFAVGLDGSLLWSLPLND